MDGVRGTADILEDLLMAGLLEGKLVFGSMNRGGLQGAEFEFDDRWTGYDAATLAAHGLDGGSTPSRSEYWFARNFTTAWATVRRTVWVINDSSIEL